MDDRSLFDPDELPEDLHGVIKPELAPGERLLWAGWAKSRGNSGFCLGVAWAGGNLLVCAVCFAAFFGTFGRRFATIERAIGTIGLIAGIVGFLILIATLGNRISGGSSRALVKRKCYALTDRRAIVWNPRSGTKAVEVFSYHRGMIKGLHRAEYPDGSGDVIFGRGDEQDVFSPIGFLGVAEVRRVEDLVRRVLIVPDSEQP